MNTPIQSSFVELEYASKKTLNPAREVFVGNGASGAMGVILSLAEPRYPQRGLWSQSNHDFWTLLVC